MTHRLPRVKRVAALLAATGTVALGLLLCAGSEDGAGRARFCLGPRQ